VVTPDVVDLIAEIREQLNATGLDAGPDTIAWRLEHHHLKLLECDLDLGDGRGSAPQIILR